MSNLKDEIAAIIADEFDDVHLAFVPAEHAAEKILMLFGKYVGDRAIKYDRRADDERDGVRKMQGATLATLANDLVRPAS